MFTRVELLSFFVWNFFILLGYILIGLAIIYPFINKNSTSSKYFFYSLFTGIISTTIVYAMVQARLETILGGIVIAFGLHYSLQLRNFSHISYSGFWKKIIDILSDLRWFLPVLLLIQTISYFILFEQGDPLSSYYRDEYFYARASGFLNQYGIESIFLEEIAFGLGNFKTLAPYHYFDLWHVASISRLTGLPPLLSYQLLINPLLIFVVFSTFFIVLSHHFINWPKLFLIGLGFLLTYCVAIPYVIYEKASLYMFYYHQSGYKLLYFLFPFLPLVVSPKIDFRKSGIALALPGLLYFMFIPICFTFYFILAIINMKKLAAVVKSLLPLIVYLFFFIGFYFISGFFDIETSDYTNSDYPYIIHLIKWVVPQISWFFSLLMFIFFLGIFNKNKKSHWLHVFALGSFMVISTTLPRLFPIMEYYWLGYIGLFISIYVLYRYFNLVKYSHQAIYFILLSVVYTVGPIVLGFFYRVSNGWQFWEVPSQVLIALFFPVFIAYSLKNNFFKPFILVVVLLIVFVNFIFSYNYLRNEEERTLRLAAGGGMLTFLQNVDTMFKKNKYLHYAHFRTNSPLNFSKVFGSSFLLLEYFKPNLGLELDTSITFVEHTTVPPPIIHVMETKGYSGLEAQIYMLKKHKIKHIFLDSYTISKFSKQLKENLIIKDSIIDTERSLYYYTIDYR